MKTTLTSIYRWMEKAIMVYTYNTILFSFLKKGNPVICNKMDDPGLHYVKWSNPDIERQI